MSNSKFMHRSEANSKSMMKNQAGVVLLESLIAVLIFSLGLLALAGLQGAMAANTTESQLRANALYLVQQRLGMVWGNPENTANFVETDTPLQELPNGKRSVVVSSCGDKCARVNVTVTWQQPGKPDVHKVNTVARVSY